MNISTALCKMLPDTFLFGVDDVFNFSSVATLLIFSWIISSDNNGI